jgi:hypothetical protein
MPTTKAIRKTDGTTAKKNTKKAGKPAPKAAKKVTRDDVWAGFTELNKSFAELHKGVAEFNKGLAELHELHKETEKAHKETEKTLNKAISDLSISHKETEKAIKDTQRNIGGLNNTLGSLVEHIMTPGLPRKFRQFGFTFDRITTVKWADGVGNIYTEIDGLLENGDQAMVVEVKATLRQDDIDDHLARMERVRSYADAHGDKRKFLGAMAATIVDRAVKTYALSKGFFVIEPSGEDVKITKPVSDPRVW